MLETETGDLTTLETLDDARPVAWEFWDILDDDFRFWDAAGRVVTMTEPFSKGVDSEPEIGAGDARMLRQLIEAFLDCADENAADRDPRRSAGRSAK